LWMCLSSAEATSRKWKKNWGFVSTVKNKLEDVANALGHKSEEAPVEETNRKEILDKLYEGEISVDEALELLKG